MKNIKKQIEIILEQVNDKILDRECIFDDRTETWQESENGENHQEKTELMIEAKENLEMTLDSLNAFFGL